MRKAIVGALVAVIAASSIGAQAKEPPSGIDVCGIDGCHRLVPEDAARLWRATFVTARRVDPAAPTPFFVVRWSWPQASGATLYRTDYWVPGVDELRTAGDRSASWFALGRDSAAALEGAAVGLRPFPVPRVTRALVGRRVAANPSSFLLLSSIGRRVGTWPGTRGWIRITLKADAPSPWTDAATEVRVSRAKGFVWRDRAAYRIPLELARRARRAASLGFVAPPPRPIDSVIAPASCPVTVPNGSVPPGESPSPPGASYVTHGNGSLWTDLSPSGTITARSPNLVRPDGSIDIKFPWWRAVHGQLAVEGRRLDRSAPPLSAELAGGYGDIGLQPSGVIFATAGCWEVTGKVSGAKLTAVVLVLRA